MINGWDSAWHSLVFGDAVKSFDAWAKVAAQADAAWAEDWKKTGLATT